jgi:predicted transcriptional regulator
MNAEKRGDLLRYWAAKYRLTNIALAEMMGRSYATISDWRNGRTELNDHSFVFLQHKLKERFGEDALKVDEYNPPV